MNLGLEFAVRSDRGSVRPDNQDAAYANDRVLAVADGVGGGPAGDIASSLIIRSFADIMSREPLWDAVDDLRGATIRGEEAIAQHVEEHPEHDGMATTLTAVMMDGNRLGMLHVGDSRAYLLRSGVLYQLSHDDTLVQSMVEHGILTKDAARTHPERNVVLKVLSGRTTRVSLANFEVHLEDRIILCSDGVSDVLSERELALLGSGADLDTCADEIISVALTKGSRDNVTCIVARVVPSAESQMSSSRSEGVADVPGAH